MFIPGLDSGPDPYRYHYSIADLTRISLGANSSKQERFPPARLQPTRAKKRVVVYFHLARVRRI